MITCAGLSSVGSVFFRLLRGASADALPPAEGASFRFGAIFAAANLHIHTKLIHGISGVQVVTPVLCPWMACVQHYIASQHAVRAIAKAPIVESEFPGALCPI